jgi:glycosyltransferase involved in cell wall biosynthesis
MKIAQVAPLAESVPPRLYGGTERVVSYLAEELVGLGHEVTLFASGDSRTAARLVAGAPRALRLDPEVTDALPHHLLLIERVRARAHEFDMLHFHVEHVHLPLFRPFAHKSVTTLHGRLDLPDLAPLYREFSEMPLVSISNSQRKPLEGANWAGTVYHGLPDAVCPYTPAPRGDYLAFLGRISPEKGIEHGPIEYIGEVSEQDKPAFLGNASALLFPIDWPEPFGLVMIEAMACGTPVIAYPRGSVPEIVDPDVSGFIVSTVDEGVAAVGAAARLDRARVRGRFEQRFTATRMALDYLAVYRRLAARKSELVP